MHAATLNTAKEKRTLSSLWNDSVVGWLHSSCQAMAGEHQSSDANYRQGGKIIPWP